MYPCLCQVFIGISYIFLYEPSKVSKIDADGLLCVCFMSHSYIISPYPAIPSWTSSWMLSASSPAGACAGLLCLHSYFLFHPFLVPWPRSESLLPLFSHRYNAFARLFTPAADHLIRRCFIRVVVLLYSHVLVLIPHRDSVTLHPVCHMAAASICFTACLSSSPIRSPRCCIMFHTPLGADGLATGLADDVRRCPVGRLRGCQRYLFGKVR